MTRDTFEAFAAALLSAAHDVLVTKGKDYAREDNPFHNFEMTADFTGQTREQVLGGHMYKHVASVFRYIRDGHLDSEGLRGRAIDLINYAVFLVAMAEDDAPIKVNMADLAATQAEYNKVMAQITDSRDKIEKPQYDLGENHTWTRVVPLGGDYARVTNMLTGESEVLRNGEPVVDLGADREVVVEAVDPYYPNRYHLYTDKNGVRVYTAEPHEEDA